MVDLGVQMHGGAGYMNVEELINMRKPSVAFSMGAMGSATTNFYNAAFQRAGFEDEARAIQQLWSGGKRKEAVGL